MYDELVKSLRQCAEASCARCKNDLVEVGCRGKLQREAADAIEELSRWIPVTEQLPEEWKPVLCYYEYFRYGEYNCMFRTMDRGYYGDGIWGGEAGQGHKNKVLAWMPLPEPPKEE